MRRYRDLKSRILRNVIAFTLIPIVCGVGINLAILVNDRFEDYRINVENEIGRINQLINMELGFFASKSILILTDRRIMGLLRQVEPGCDHKIIVDLNSEVRRLLSDLYMFSSYAVPVTFFLHGYDGVSGANMRSMDHFYDQELAGEILAVTDSTWQWGKELVPSSQGRNYIHIYQNVANSSRYPAFLRIAVPYDEIRNYFVGLEIPVGSVVVHKAENGDTLYATEPWDESPSGEDSYFRFTPSVNSLINGSEIIAYVPKRDFLLTLVPLFSGSVAVILVFCMVLLMVSRYTSGRITRRLNNFIGFLSENEETPISAHQIEIEGTDEIAYIKKRFLEVIKKNNATFSELLKTRSHRNKLQIELLQARINPHLLYNSLSAIKWTALRNQDERTAEIIDTMTDYYRIALNRGEEQISLADEIRMITQYVKIVNFAHSRDHQMDLRIQDEASSIRIPSHLLQPIVENALLHGLNGIPRGIIVLLVERRRRGTFIAIEDNGAGMEPETVQQLLTGSYRSPHGGYGVRNVQNRLRAFYGSESEFSVTSRIDHGTIVEIFLPDQP